MNNITKYNLKTAAVSVSGLILLLCALSYLIAPQGDGFLSSINPLGILEGMVFALGFGLGIPLWLSIVVIVVISCVLFIGLLWLVRKVIK